MDSPPTTLGRILVIVCVATVSLCAQPASCAPESRAIPPRIEDITKDVDDALTEDELEMTMFFVGVSIVTFVIVVAPLIPGVRPFK